MCMGIVKKKYPAKSPLDKTGYGWKVFDVGGGDIYGRYSTGPRPYEKWLNSRNYMATEGASNIGRTYPLGWHIYKKHQSTRDGSYIAQRKVKYRGVLAEGEGMDEDGNVSPIIVARWLYIYPEKKTGGEIT